MNSKNLFAAAAALTAVAAPAAAQSYQQPYPTYQQPYQQAYPGYGQQGYGQNSGVVGQIIDQLLGNRYNVNDRTAVSQCASAALAQAQVQYRGYGQGYGGQGYGGGYQSQGYNQYPGQGYNQGYGQAMRVTAITDVQRRSGTLRVKGMIATGQRYGGTGGYGGGYGAQGYDPRYANAADLTFRCNVDYRGQVTNVRLSQNMSNYRR